MGIHQIINLLAEKEIQLYLDLGILKSKSPKGAMNAELISLIKNNKTELITFLTKAVQGQDAQENAIVKVSRQEAIPLSFAQQRLWLVNQLETQSSHYNMPLAFSVKGPFSVEAAEKAFARIVERHEILRTVYHVNNGKAEQVINPVSDCILTVIDFNEKDHGQHQVHRVVAQEAVKPFDLTKDLMLRASWIQQTDEQGILLFNMHHIASDGWSMGILVREFIDVYQAVVEGEPDSLPPLAIQYADYAIWQKKNIAGSVLQKQLDYWHQQLADAPIIHSLSLDYERPEKLLHQGARVVGTIDSGVAQDLIRLAKQQGATPFMLLHAGLSLLLSRYSNTTDIIIGTPVANRLNQELTPLLGCFVNTLVLRSNSAKHDTFLSYLEHIKQLNLDAQANQDVPFEQLVEHLNVGRNNQVSPLVQIMFSMDTNEQEPLQLNGLTFSALDTEELAAKFDLNLASDINEKGVTLNWIYDKALFNASTIEQMNGHLINLLTAISADPTTLKDLPMLLPQELDHQIHTLNPPTMDYQPKTLIHNQFELQASLYPENVALIYQDEQLDYRQLDEAASRLAHYLSEQGVGRETLVGICVERSLSMVIGVLAILKAGGAYVPIDKDAPKSRIEHIISDSQIQIILTQSDLVNQLDLKGILRLEQDVIDDQMDEYSSKWRNDEEPLSTSLAYVIYTSGSTGLPKGVLQTHENATRLFSATAKDFCFDQTDVWTLFHSIAFDFSVWELWGALIHGAQLVIPSTECTRDTEQFTDLCRKHRVSVLNQTPSAFKQFSLCVLESNNPLASLRYVIFGGEALQVQSLIPWWQRFGDSQPQLVNMFGITETTVHVTLKRLTADDGELSLIGKPISDQTLYLLDSHLNPVPLGAPGEIYVGGAGLARGYHNQPQLTQERFINNPFATEKMRSQGYHRLYKTGDLALYTSAGQLAYLGRNDEQVKIRGFRVELGEIEQQLMTLEYITDVIVHLLTHDNGDKYLLAYAIVMDDRKQHVLDSWRKTLSNKVPAYMMPLALIVVYQWPLTVNGKVDRKALPKLNLVEQQTEYAAPTTESEEVLCAIWKKVLDIDRVGINDNFFELGGHSLLVVKLISLAQEVGLSITAAQLFQSATLADLSASADDPMQKYTNFNAPDNLIPVNCRKITADMLPLITLNESQIANVVSRVQGGDANIQDIYPLAPLQHGILFHHMMSEGSDPYVTPMMFRLENRALLDNFLDALRFVISRHDALRTAILYKDVPQSLQVVYSHVDLPVKWVELDPDQDAFSQMQALCEPALQWLDVQSAPLLHVQAASDSNSDDYFVIVQLHHLIDDITSMQILREEVVAYLQGKEQALPKPKPYREFVAHTLHMAEHFDAEVFFKAQLGDVETPTLPFNLLDIQGGDTTIDSFKTQVPTDISQQIFAVCKSLKISPAVLFHGAWALVVGLCSGRDDVVFGTVFSGRLQGTDGADSIFGMLISTLPLRVKVKNLSVLEFIRHVEVGLQELIPFEQTSLAKIQNCSSVPSSMPLFSSLLNYRHLEQKSVKSDKLKGLNIVGGEEASNYPFSLSVTKATDDFLLNYQIDNRVSCQKVNGYMQTALTCLLDRFSSTSMQSVKSLTILPEKEQQELLNEWQNPLVEYPSSGSIHQRFELLVEQNPDAIAVIFKEQRLTYAELNQQANRLANYLIQNRQIKPDTVIGVCFEHCVDMLVAILAILKAGGAYLPLATNHPKSRLEYMIADSQLATVLTHQRLLEHTAVDGVEALCLDDSVLLTQLSGYMAENIDPALIGLKHDHLAYVIYTSGSTGQPKGVCISHANWLAYAKAVEVDYQLDVTNGSGRTERVLQFSSIAFDIFVAELTSSIFNGGTLMIPGFDQVPTLENFWHFVNNNQVTVVTLPTAYWHQLAADVRLQQYITTSPLKLMAVGGEAIYGPHLQQWQHHVGNKIRLLNLYGPTEATVSASYFDVTEFTVDDQPVPIGKYTTDSTLLILDSHQKLVPQGVAGELYIGGPCLARGYLNKPDLSEKQFIDNPFYDAKSAHSTKRLYKTGDKVCWLEDGNIGFLGRIDQQVKIRGFRIELGEIEHELIAMKEVENAVVLALGSVDNQILVGYIVADNPLMFEQDGAINNELSVQLTTELRQQLSIKLPDYMLPGVLMVLPELPLTVNGKIDRKALPQPDMQQAQCKYMEPNTDREKAMCNIWQQLLGIKQVGLNDNFFELGGHSLLAVKLISLIAERLGNTVSIKTLFSYPTLKPLVDYIDASNKNDIGHVNFSLTSLSSSYSGDKLFFAPALGLMGLSYQGLAATLANRFKLVVLTTPGIDEPVSADSPLLKASVVERVEQWYQAIKAEQPSGPYRLMGHSFGGAMVFELAHRLGSNGDEVSLVLLDSVLATPSLQQKNTTLAELLLGRSSVDSLSDSLSNRQLYQQLLDVDMLPEELSLAQFELYCLAAKQQMALSGSYQPSKKFTGLTYLVMASQGLLVNEAKEEILEHIQAWCQQPLRTSVVEGDHLSVIKNPVLATELIELLNCPS
jgi:amino acid adenylation domain-containing protein